MTHFSPASKKLLTFIGLILLIALVQKVLLFSDKSYMTYLKQQNQKPVMEDKNHELVNRCDLFWDCVLYQEGDQWECATEYAPLNKTRLIGLCRKTITEGIPLKQIFKEKE